MVLVFRVIKPTTDDWQVFVHVEDAEGRGERLNADHPLRVPTSTWKAGELVQDEFALTLPPGWRVTGGERLRRAVAPDAPTRG